MMYAERRWDVGTENNKLKVLRERAGLSQEELAILMGQAGWDKFSRENITRYEQGVGLKFVDAIRYAQCCNARLDEMAKLLYPDMPYNLYHNPEKAMEDLKNNIKIENPKGELYEKTREAMSDYNITILNAKDEDSADNLNLKVIAGSGEGKSCQLIMPTLLREMQKANDNYKPRPRRSNIVLGGHASIAEAIMKSEITHCMEEGENLFIVIPKDSHYKNELVRRGKEKGYRVVDIASLNDIDIKSMLMYERYDMRGAIDVFVDCLLEDSRDPDDFWRIGTKRILIEAFTDILTEAKEGKLASLLLDRLDGSFELSNDISGVVYDICLMSARMAVTNLYKLNTVISGEQRPLFEALLEKHIYLITEDAFSPYAGYIIPQYARNYEFSHSLDSKSAHTNIFVFESSNSCKIIPGSTLYEAIASYRFVNFNLRFFSIENAQDTFDTVANDILKIVDLGVATEFCSYETLSYIHGKKKVKEKTRRGRKKLKSEETQLHEYAMHLRKQNINYVKVKAFPDNEVIEYTIYLTHENESRQDS